jgi:hypothetical protein
MPGAVTGLGIKFFDIETLSARYPDGAMISTINVQVIPLEIEAAVNIDTFEFSKKAVWIWILD